eukprot:1230991-Prorocentrum_lima.AAC.1
MLLDLEPKLFRKGRVAPCAMHGTSCPLWQDGLGDLNLHVAGITCKDFSPMDRSRQRHLGPSGRAL